MNAMLFSRLQHSLKLLLPETSLSVRFARGAFWSLMGTVFAQGLGLLSSIAAARLLGLIGFGKYGIIISTVGTFGIFAGLGLGLTATKYIAEYRSEDPQRAGRILGLSTLITVGSAGIVAAILFILAPSLATSMLSNPNLVSELRWGCALLFFNAFTGMQTGALTGFEAFRTVAQVNLVRSLLNFPILIVGIGFWSVSGAVVASVVVAAIHCCLNGIALRRQATKFNVSFQYRNISSELPMLWRFSLPAMLSSMMVFPTLWLANTIIARQPEGFAQLGLLSAANQWTAIIALLPNTVAGVAIPTISSLLGSDRTEKQSEHGIELVNMMNQAILWPISILFMFGSPFIAGIYGRDFDQGYPIFMLLIGGYAIGYVGNAVGTLLVSKGKMWLGALLNFTWGIVILVITYFGVASSGATSLGIGTIAAYLIVLIWPALYLAHRNEMPPTLAKRVISGGIIMLLSLMGAILLPPEISVRLAVPLAVLSVPFAVYGLSSKELRRALWAKAMQLETVAKAYYFRIQE